MTCPESRSLFFSVARKWRSILLASFGGHGNSRPDLIGVDTDFSQNAAQQTVSDLLFNFSVEFLVENSRKGKAWFIESVCPLQPYTPHFEITQWALVPSYCRNTINCRLFDIASS